MAQKYHINAQGKVEKCRAFIRACPFRDYDTEEAARTSLYLKKEKDHLQEMREEINHKLSEKFGEESYINLNLAPGFADDRFSSSTLAAVNKIDALVNNGKDPAILFLTSEISDKVFNKKEVSFVIKRFPKADYANGKIVSDWEIEVRDVRKKDVEKISLDFDNNYHGTIQNMREIFRKAAIRNVSGEPLYGTGYDDAADRMLKKVEQVYTVGEEETMGVYEANEKFKAMGLKDVGTFSKSKEHNINLDLDVNTTTFRPAVLEEYISNNQWFTSAKPNMFLRVYNNEDEQSPAWWGVTYNNNDGWGVQSRIGLQDSTYVLFDNSDEIKTYVENFVRKNMKTNDEITAQKSGKYVKNLMTGVNNVIENHNRQVDELIYGDTRKQENKKSDAQHNELLGKTNEKSTVNSILDMFS